MNGIISVVLNSIAAVVGFVFIIPLYKIILLIIRNPVNENIIKLVSKNNKCFFFSQ